jgi:hypothetical protein
MKRAFRVETLLLPVIVLSVPRTTVTCKILRTGTYKMKLDL